MHRKLVVASILAALTLVVPMSFALVAPPAGSVLANFDSRSSGSALEDRSQEISVRLREQLELDVLLSVDPIRGVPRSLRAADRRSFLTAGSDLDELEVARQFLADHRGAYGLSDEEIVALETDTDFVTDHNGIRHIWFQQRLGGIDVYGGRIGINISLDGRILNVNAGPYLAGAEHDPGDLAASQPAEQAVYIAAELLGESFLGNEMPRLTNPPEDHTFLFDRGQFRTPITAKRVYFPTADGARLAWSVTLDSSSYPAMYEQIIDARTGELLFRFNLTNYLYEADAYTINPDMTPIRDTWSLLEADRAPSSPLGWYDDNIALAISNNVIARADADSCQPNHGPFEDVPEQSPDWDFKFPIDLTLEPDTYRHAAIANLFVINNMFHDRIYERGFTEEAGAFQTDNFGFLPAGDGDGDAVDAQAQDKADCPAGGSRNNANFSTPADGSPGRMQMFLWTGTPERDGDLDADIIIHEFCHGLSHRLVGGRTCVGGCALGADQAGAMGEAWGDFFGSSYSNEEAVAEYSNGLARGLRSNPFTSMPWTLESLGMMPCQVHLNGEIWGATLWDIRVEFVSEYGLDPGSVWIERYVVDSLKTMPTAPSFHDARDAMIASARSGIDECLMWTGFAGRGFGEDSVNPSASCTSAVVDGMVIPATCPCAPGITTDVTANSLRAVEGRFEWASSGPGRFNLHHTPAKDGLDTLRTDLATLVAWPAASEAISPRFKPGYYQVFGIDVCTGDSQP